MNFEEFEQLSRSYKVIPVSKSLLADTVSPVSAYLRLRGQNPEPPHGGTTNAATFLLESVEGGERIARYSFIGRDPLFLVRSSGQTTELVRGGVVEKRSGDLFDLLGELLREYSQPPHPLLPRFTGGLVGFIGYDAVRSIEKLPCSVVNDAGFEDSILGLFNKIVAFDHLRHQVIIIVNTLVDRSADLRAQYEHALTEIAAIETMLRTPEQPPARFEHPPAKPTAETSREDFEKIVTVAKKYITEGDIFQVVLSQRFSSQFGGDLFNLYRALRVINPSPYLYFLDFGETKIAGSSPEILVRAESGVAEVYPIAGTRPRGATEAQDKALEKDLLADEKELAEHIMLVDLGRNDLGRVCEIGTVKVSDMMNVVKYSHVMHIASRVTGKMVPGKTCVDVLRATFPAGTVSGAPKIRAMEIIDELESSRRTIYAGGVGYFDFSGNMDFCIAIRTLFAKGSKLYFQAGAGIVADSDPAREFEETLNKSRVIVDAIKLAQEILLMILVIDNYDSFTYNLVQLVGSFQPEVDVIRNDQSTVPAIAARKPSGIIISPGPGRPENAGICVDLIRRLGPTIPILGVCLGHQAIGLAYGGTITYAPCLMHGKTSEIHHHGAAPFGGLPSPFPATRYHSLVISPQELPTELEVTATTADGTIMAVRHRMHPIIGIQFHPESILTAAGGRIISNWLETLRPRSDVKTL